MSCGERASGNVSPTCTAFELRFFQLNLKPHPMCMRWTPHQPSPSESYLSCLPSNIDCLTPFCSKPCSPHARDRFPIVSVFSSLSCPPPANALSQAPEDEHPPYIGKWRSRIILTAVGHPNPSLHVEHPVPLR